MIEGIFFVRIHSDQESKVLNPNPVIVRSTKEERFFSRNLKKGNDFIKWEIGSTPPPIDSNFSGFVIVTNLYPLTEQVQWWLGKLTVPFIVGNTLNVPLIYLKIQNRQYFLLSKCENVLGSRS